MYNLNFEFRGFTYSNIIIKINGKLVKLKKRDNRGFYHLDYTSDSKSVELKIFSFLDLKGRLWFLSSLLLFFISIFGLLDIQKGTNGKAFTYFSVLDLNEGNNKIIIGYKGMRKDITCIESKQNFELCEVENTTYIDEQYLKRRKIMRIVKVLIIVFIILLGIISLIVR